MPSSINKPTGLGYQGSPWRQCTACGHLETTHFGRCHASLGRKNGHSYCPCKGFCAREISAEERSIIDQKVEAELEYVGEALYTMIKREAAK